MDMFTGPSEAARANRRFALVAALGVAGITYVMYGTSKDIGSGAHSAQPHSPYLGRPLTLPRLHAQLDVPLGRPQTTWRRAWPRPRTTSPRP